jgi:hypothetical protein
LFPIAARAPGLLERCFRRLHALRQAGALRFHFAKSGRALLFGAAYAGCRLFRLHRLGLLPRRFRDQAARQLPQFGDAPVELLCSAALAEAFSVVSRSPASSVAVCSRSVARTPPGARGARSIHAMARSAC